MRLRKARRASFLYVDEGAANGEVGTLQLSDVRPTPEAALGDSELTELMHREIGKLPPLLRNVLVMRDLQELSMGDVAQRLGITIVAAKSRLLRARAELRQRLEKHFGPGGPRMIAA
jgi:RNA polymerase sigma-70 factor (ECF subfamily)